MGTLELISQLRNTTGAGMMDCKKALEEADGDMQKAQDILRKKGAVKAAEREGKVAAEGAVASYIHAGGRIGVLLELNCETDFVGKTDGFQELARELCLHIAAANPRYLAREDVPAAVLERERAVYVDQMKAEGKPQNIIDKAVEGKLNAFYKEVCLLEQAFIKDEEKTVRGLLDEKVAELGEKITLRRFSRFELGEGIEKTKTDFAAEVAEQLGG